MDLPGMPSRGPLVIPAPFRFQEASLFLFFARTQALENLKALLPPVKGLRLWHPLFAQGTILITLAHYPRVWAEAFPALQFSYQEAIISIPCTHVTTGPATYCAVLYLNDATAICGGREIYGFPKKPAEISIKEDNGGGRTEVQSRGESLIQAAWQNAEEKKPQEVVKWLVDIFPQGDLLKGAFRWGAGMVEKHLGTVISKFKMPILNWRRIPEVSATLKNPTYAINEVTSVKPGVEKIHRFRKLAVDEDAVILTGTALDPLDQFTPLSTQGALRVDMDFTLPPGKILAKLGKK